MKTITHRTAGVTLAASLFLGGSLRAQEQENFVLEDVSFRTVSVFAPNPNSWEVDATGEGDFRTGIGYDEFIGLLNEGIANHTGGVIDFEAPIPGLSLRSPDRRGHRAIMEQFFLDNPIEAYIATVKEQNPGISDNDAFVLAGKLQWEEAYASAEAGADLDSLIAFEARIDRGRTDEVDNPVVENTFFRDVIGLYGPNGNTPIRFSRNINQYTEAGGTAATLSFPMYPDPKALVNGQFFVSTGLSTYSGNNSNRPVSGTSTLNHGMLDLGIDPRDNVKVLGFVLLNFGNFQYYQGDGGVPINPDNVRVHVEFSDGSSDLLYGTTEQQSGSHDMFFGIKAPEGASITRVWIRVKGNNSRTFVAVDDLSFVAEPSLSYIASDTSVSGSAGAGLFYQLAVGQNATSVSISGLPAGVTLDPETLLISGVPASAGTYEAQVTMTNAVGDNTETLTFVIAEAVDPAEVPAIDPLADASVVLRRDLVPIEISTSRDEVALPGEISFFSRVYRILEGGAKELTSLADLGLVLRGDVISGRPSSASQIGKFEVTVFAFNEMGGDSESFILDILSPTLMPNYDGNGTTDILFRDGASIFGAVSTPVDGGFELAAPAVRISGVAASSDLFLGDFDGNSVTDIAEWNASTGSVRIHFSEPETRSFETVTLLEGILADSGESVINVADLDGDGYGDLLWQNSKTGALSAWRMRGQSILWAGFFRKSGPVADLLLSGDFSGGGGSFLLWDMGDGEYTMERGTLFRSSDGTVQIESLSFINDSARVPVLATDFNADGRADILWTDVDTGAVYLWLMNGLNISPDYLDSSEEDATPVALPGIELLPPGHTWGLVSATDLNNDQRADLVLRDRQTGALGALMMNIDQSLSAIITIGASDDALLSMGDLSGNSRADFVIRNTTTGACRLVRIDESSVTSQTYGGVPANASFLTEAVIVETPAPSFDLNWFGAGYIFADARWMYLTNGYGWMAASSIDPVTDSGWFYDEKLGFFWTAPEIYPNIYQDRNAFWLYYYEGTSEPRMFYNYLFFFDMSEDEL